MIGILGRRSAKPVTKKFGPRSMMSFDVFESERAARRGGGRRRE
jgi:hypothetical protein